MNSINLQYFFKKLSLVNINLLLVAFLIFLSGIFTLYSTNNGNFSGYVLRQFTFFISFIPLFIFLTVVKINYIYRFSYIFYIISLILLISVAIKGYHAMGAVRWIRLFGFSLQPSEFMKVGIVFLFATYFSKIKITKTRQIRYLIIPIIVLVIPVILILKQPDLGTSIILIVIGIYIFFLIGVQWWKFVICFVLMLSSTPFIWKYKLHNYQKTRIEVFLGIKKDNRGVSYNIQQSKIAIGSAGMMGKGYLLGSQIHNNLLPEKHTDFIFASTVEENGFIFSSFLMLLYLILILYIFWISINSIDLFDIIVTSGFAFIFFIHFFINIGMVMGILPVVGVPLPFMSYGGTITTLSFSMISIIMNIDIKNKIKKNNLSNYLNLL